MAERLNRGEIWLLDRPRPDKRRPVLILSRPALIPLLHTVTVRQRELGTYVGTVSREKMAEVCRALVIACACE